MIIHWYTLDDFTADFLAVRNDFSREALALLFEFYDSIGEPIEFDPIAMCCEWSEYSDPIKAIEDYEGCIDYEVVGAFYMAQLSEGKTPADALESVLGVPVLWDGASCFLVGV